MTPRRLVAFSCLFALFLATAVSAQNRPDPKQLIAAQKDAMKALDRLDGVWRGPASTTEPSGKTHAITQTERVGPFLDGAVKVIEGRGYEDDGSVAFNAFAVISYDPAAKSYAIRSYAMGYKGDYALKPTDDGFVWEIPAGPAKIRYTIVIEDDVWHEVGDRIVEGKEPIRFFEMRLERIDDTTWPAGGAIPPK